MAAALVVCCGPPRPTVTEWTPLPEATPDEVAAVVFLVGDAGAAFPGGSPVLATLGREVEAWSARLARDSAVSVLYLGDIVYPVGVRDRGTVDFRTDSLHVQAQVDAVSGPAARRHGSLGIFLAGNHDWGQMAGLDGIARVRNLEFLLDAMAEQQEVAVELQPPAGEPGPVVVDVRDHVRFVFLDTHWWLQARNEQREDSVVLAIGDALEGAGEREVVFAAHHPFVSGGPHGGPMPFWEGLGLIYILRRSGALIQDVNSPPYRELRLGLRGLFTELGRPLLWAGGHDHSLQVFQGEEEGDRPLWSVVSGSGSKLTEVAGGPGMVYGADRPGFMRLTLLTSGEAQLHVYAGSEEHLLCRGDDAAIADCMAEGTAAFEVVWARRLR